MNAPAHLSPPHRRLSPDGRWDDAHVVAPAAGTTVLAADDLTALADYAWGPGLDDRIPGPASAAAVGAKPRIETRDDEATGIALR